MGLAIVAAATCNTQPMGDGSSASDEQRLADVEHVLNMTDAAMNDSGRVDMPALMSMLGTLGGVAGFEEYDGGITLQFADGELLFVIDNREPGEDITDEIADAPATARIKHDVVAARVPVPPQALLMNGMGSFYTNPISTFSPWLTSAGYDVRRVEATVENFKNLGSLGLLYVSTHGIRFRGSQYLPNRPYTVELDSDVLTPAPTTQLSTDGKDHFALWTTTKLTNDTINRYRELLRTGRLAYSVAKVDRGPQGRPTLEAHLAITELWVTDPVVGWHFRSPSTAPQPHTFVYIDACSSADPLFWPACLQAGATYYLGWTTPTNDKQVAQSTRFLFDRLTGANSVGPFRDPPQRPFNERDILAAMRTLQRSDGTTLDTSVDIIHGEQQLDSLSMLVRRDKQGSPAAQLRPGLRQVIPDEQNQKLILFGDFGDRAGKVFIGGSERELTGLRWTATRVECELQSADLGEVYVRVNGHNSNPRWISAWDMVVRRKLAEITPPYCSDCFANMTWRYRLRFDTLPVRDEIEKPARSGGHYSNGRRGATFTMNSIDGTGMIGGHPVELSQIERHPAYFPDPTPALGGGEWFSITGVLNSQSRTLVVNVHVDTDAERRFYPDSGDSQVTHISVHGSSLYVDHPFNLNIQLDNDWNIPPGGFNTDAYGSRYEWEGASILSAPPAGLPI
ncbi:MAG: hypothetical protein U1A27_03655 [Phycisphaerae bacterium]